MDPATIAHLQILGLGVSEARGIFKLLDLDCRDMVSINELVLGLMRLTGHAKGVDIATLMYENKRIMMRLTAFMHYMEDIVNGKAKGTTSVNDYIRTRTMSFDVGKEQRTMNNDRTSAETLRIPA